MSDKKCPNCGACKECGARLPVVVYPNWWPSYAPYPQTTWTQPFTYGNGSTSASGGTYSGNQTIC